MANIPISCETALTITNGSNRICQNFITNSAFLNYFNTSDAQIVVVGKSFGSIGATANTGSIYLNSQNTYLCSNTDSSPSTYIRYATDASRTATQTFKANPFGVYSADATVSVTKGGSLINENAGEYSITAGSVVINVPTGSSLSVSGNMTQIGSSSNSVYNISTSSIFTIDYIDSLPETYIKNLNANLNSAYNSVSTRYKADTRRTNAADATITVLPCIVSAYTVENAGRFCITADTVEPIANLLQTGSYAQFVTKNTTYPSYIRHVNSGATLVSSNIVGTYYKADESKAYVSDGSITVRPNSLASMFSATVDPTDYGQMNINAKDIYIGNATSNVYVSGTLYVPYTNSAGVASYVTLGQYMRQMTRTRAA